MSYATEQSVLNSQWNAAQCAQLPSVLYRPRLMADGEVVVRADADCCSYTWVEHVDLPALGFPATVVAVDDLELPDRPESTFHKNPDALEFYGCKITTDRGEIIIDYRNDSNGYYGGSLAWPGEYFYGGVYGQNVSKEEWQPIS